MRHSSGTSCLTLSRSAIFAHAAEQWQVMKQDYVNHVDYQYLAAVEHTNGVLVNQLGRADGIDGYELFTGPWNRARKYASEELLEFWKQIPRLTLKDYEDQWVTGQEHYQ